MKVIRLGPSQEWLSVVAQYCCCSMSGSTTLSAATRVCCTGGSGDQLAFDDHRNGTAQLMLATFKIDTAQRESQGAGTLTASSTLLITRRCGFGRSQMDAHLAHSHPLTLCSLPETVEELVNIGTIQSVSDCSRAFFDSTRASEVAIAQNYKGKAVWLSTCTKQNLPEAQTWLADDSVPSFRLRLLRY
jgi:hypothetical protein